MRSTPGFMRFVVLVLSISLVTLSGGCRDSDSHDDGGNGPNFEGSYSIIKHSDAGTCGDEEKISTYASIITVNGDQISIDEVGDEEGAATATLNGHTATFDIPEEHDYDDWTGSTHIEITFSDDWLTLTGHGSWYEENGPDRCEGTFTLTGTKDDAAALCIGDWVQVNFLGTDEDGNVEEWDDDSTDPEGIGFVASISATEWAERDEYGYGEEVVFSYTINGDRFVKSIGGYTDTGRLEFPDENTMIEWWDYPAGAPEELIAFKWKRQ